MKLKRIYYMLLLSAMAAPAMTSCDDDTDSNPTFHEADTFVLNESAYAQNNTIDLSADGTVVSLTCNQPDYGFPVATVYTVQLSFDGTFADSSDVSYVEMSTTFTSTEIDIDATEMNSSLLELWESVYGDEDVPTDPVAVYVRLTAIVSGQDIGYSVSNVICLPSVLMSATSSGIELPECMYLAGSHNGWTFAAMAAVYGLEGQWYQVVYLELDEWGNNGSFKFGTKENDWIGTDDERLTVTYTGGDLEENSDNNIMLPNTGWYTVFIDVSTSGSDYLFDMTIMDAAVYIISPTAAGAWAIDGAWLFTDSGNGTLLSPAIDSSGELRMAVDCGLDWWRTEFTLKDGSEIYYRSVDIPSNWAEDVGSEYSVTVNSGDVVELDFNNGTGSVN